jgi:hypothetical protein
MHLREKKGPSSLACAFLAGIKMWLDKARANSASQASSKTKRVKQAVSLVQLALTLKQQARKSASFVAMARMLQVAPVFARLVNQATTTST